MFIVVKNFSTRTSERLVSVLWICLRAFSKTASSKFSKEREITMRGGRGGNVEGGVIERDGMVEQKDKDKVIEEVWIAD